MRPKLITRQMKADNAAKAWEAQYDKPDKKQREIGATLVALGPSPNPDDVDRVIGNDTWTSPGRCGGCDSWKAQTLVQVGAEPDYESETALLCGDCLRAAVALLEVPDVKPD